MISLLAHTHSAVVSIWRDYEEIMPNSLSVQSEKPHKQEEVAAFVQAEILLPGRSHKWTRGTRRADFILDISTFFLVCIIEKKTSVASFFFPHPWPLHSSILGKMLSSQNDKACCSYGNLFSILWSTEAFTVINCLTHVCGTPFIIWIKLTFIDKVYKEKNRNNGCSNSKCYYLQLWRAKRL